MQTRRPIGIPVVSATTQQEEMADSACSGKEMVALTVLGDSMEPEFVEGEILVIEMGAPAVDGSFVIAQNEEYIFRQLMRGERGGWQLHALNHAYPDVAISGLDAVMGVVTHKRKPGSRKSVKFYDQQQTH